MPLPPMVMHIVSTPSAMLLSLACTPPSPPGACSPLALVQAPQDQSLAAAPRSRSRTKQSCWITPCLHSAAGRARAEAVPGAKHLAHPGRVSTHTPHLPAPQISWCAPEPVPPPSPSPLPFMPSPKGTSSGVQHGIPLALCHCTTKTLCRQLAAPGSGEEEKEGVAARPHRSWGHSAWQGHLRLAAVIVAEDNGLAASMPTPAQSALRGAPAITARESQAGGVEWGDVIDGEV